MFDANLAAERRRALILPDSTQNEYYTFLHTFFDDDNLSAEGIREKEMKRIDKLILKDYGLNIDNQIRTNTDGRLYIHLGSKLKHQFKLKSDLINGRTREEILDKLIIIFYRDSAHTLTEAYKAWMKHRMEIKVDPKTLVENKNDWVSFIENSSLAQMYLKDITPADLNHFYDSITRDYMISSKRFVNIKCIINGIMSYYIDLGVIKANPVVSSNKTSYYNKRFKTSPPREAYSDSDVNAILDYIGDTDDIYDQAVKLSFFLFVRISELVPLKYEDVSDGFLNIHRTTRRARETYIDENGEVRFGKIFYRTEERMKGNKNSGFRKVPLTDEAVNLIEKVHNAAPDNEYLFMYRGHQLRSDTFNHHIKAICESLGIPYMPSHQIRFTNATRLHKAGVPLEELSVMMGHSDIATTIHYLRRNEASDSTVELARNILSPSKSLANASERGLNEFSKK